VVAVAKAIEQKTEQIKQNLVDTTVHITSADALVAIDQLNKDAGKAQIFVITSSTPALITTNSTSTTSTVPVVVPGPTSTTVPAVLPRATRTSSSTSAGAGTIITTKPVEDPNKNFPERPAELAPDVVDVGTPIKIETWE
jgi:hypothetical protein